MHIHNVVTVIHVLKISGNSDSSSDEFLKKNDRKQKLPVHAISIGILAFSLKTCKYFKEGVFDWW